MIANIKNCVMVMNGDLEAADRCGLSCAAKWLIGKTLINIMLASRVHLQ
jgi:hypothetical protein